MNSQGLQSLSQFLTTTLYLFVMSSMTIVALDPHEHYQHDPIIYAIPNTLSNDHYNDNNNNNNAQHRNTRIFYAVSSPYIGLSKAGSSWIAQSKEECANRCRDYQGDDCTSFFYDVHSGLCVPGSLTHRADGQYHANAATGALFYHKDNHCDESRSFYLALLNDTFACLFVNKSKAVSYEKAHQECHSHQAEILTPKSPKQMTDFSKLYLDVEPWVGLDNRRSRGVFKWRDTSVPLSKTQRSQLFDDGFDLSLYDDRDNSCCYYNRDWGTLDVSDCQDSKTTVCLKGF